MIPAREPARNNGQTYFVTSRTWASRELFRTPRWARLFIDTLDRYRPEQYLLHAFVLMPDHFHLIITPQITLEKAAQFIKGGFSFRAKKELNSNLEIWQRGFSDHRIRNAQDYQIHAAYIRANPVRKRLRVVPEQYPYCSLMSGFKADAVPQRLKPLDF